jgi:hypothetical protein
VARTLRTDSPVDHVLQTESRGSVTKICRHRFSAILLSVCWQKGRLCGVVVRVLGYRSGGSGSIPGTTKKKRVVGLERGPLSLVSATEELLVRKVVAPV